MAKFKREEIKKREEELREAIKPDFVDENDILDGPQNLYTKGHKIVDIEVRGDARRNAMCLLKGNTLYIPVPMSTITWQSPDWKEGN